MGQKVNPHGLRVGVIKDWDSRWYAKDKEFGDTLVEDYNIRKFLKKKLFPAGVSRIEIERDAAKARVHIHCAKPGIVIGRGGAEIEKLRLELDKKINAKRKDKIAVYVNIIEIKQPDLDALLVAESIASQLERRISFRRAMKMAIGRTMRLGAKGIKTQVSGRLGGADIARTEHYHEGTIPLQTLRADIDYGFTEATTTYGKLGVKVWIYRGEVLKLQEDAPRREHRRGDRRDSRGGDRRPGGGGNSGGNNRRPPRRDGQGQGAPRGDRPPRENREGGRR
ncbi:MAG: 30S ribosomal protein S3 [Oscillospiraceae bacterium]|jgi:small subunit ribosomal protein S3|nr:30S ribosomal protein S3 [Oscillospiraceae bacterium]